MAEARTTQQLPTADGVTVNDQFIINVSLGSDQYQLSNISIEGILHNVPDQLVVSVDQLVVRQTSSPTIPLTSNTAATPGMLWWDTDYIYVAVANNQVKRAALTTF